jgi:hypothetical protein
MSDFGRIVVWTFSVGWLLPLGAGLLLLDDWVHSILSPSIEGGASTEHLNSFPFYNAARVAFATAFLWLALATCYWAHRQLRRAERA